MIAMNRHVSSDRSLSCLALSILVVIVLSPNASAQPGNLTVYAGNGGSAPTAADPDALAVSINQPEGLALDDAGNLYVSNNSNQVIVITPSQAVDVVAGDSLAGGFDGDGQPAVNAALNRPLGLAIDGDGALLIADANNHRIRRIDGSGTITTIAGTGNPGFSGDDGPATGAELNGPQDVKVAPDGSIFIADTGNEVVRRIGAGGIITTIAGTPGMAGDVVNVPALSAQFDGLNGVLPLPGGGYLVSDFFNSSVKRVGTDGIIRNVFTAPGSGVGGIVRMQLLDETTALFSSWRDFQARTFDLASESATIIAGNGVNAFANVPGPGTSAAIGRITDVVADQVGNVFLAGYTPNRVLRLQDSLAPVITAIDPVTPSPTNADTLVFDVTFSEPVTGFDEIEVFVNASLTAAFADAQPSGSGAQYTVTVTGVEGDGTLAAGVSPGDIVDGSGNALAEGLVGPSIEVDNTPIDILGLSASPPRAAPGEEVLLTLEVSETPAIATVSVDGRSAVAQGKQIALEFSYHLVSQADAAGAADVLVTVADGAGNTSSQSFSAAFMVQEEADVPLAAWPAAAALALAIASRLRRRKQ